MPYIPPSHIKYDLLPYCRKNGGEIICYDGNLEDQIRDLLPDGIFPWGYKSYEQFNTMLDQYVCLYGIDVDRQLNELGKLILQYKEDIKKHNVKENWSVVKYVGKSTRKFTHGKYYYWACDAEKTKFNGIIGNDEAFSAYAGWRIRDTPQPLDSGDSACWEIAEDPTGMAKKELDKDKNLSD